MEEGIRNRVAHDNIPAACGSCISRREFVSKTAVLAAVVAFLDACGDSAIAEPAGPFSVKVANFAGLATIDTLVKVGEGRAAKRVGAATFAAYSLRCTHEGTEVSIVGGTSFRCPTHDSRFDNDGQVTQGPAPRRLTVLATSYDAATDTLTIG
jgi:Rieske Fe-S protein